MHNLAMTFLEGLISFVSPCMLPLLPVYVAYFAVEGTGKKGTFARAVAFTAGFTVTFTALGVFAGSLGAVLAEHRTAVNIVCGAAVIVFGLGYLGLFRLPFSGMGAGKRQAGSMVAAFVFGLVYSINLTPCVGAFLGAALMQAAGEGGAAKGALLLLSYSLGLGVPFVLSAVLLDRCGAAFGFIKRHYGIINPACGLLLVVFGTWMIVRPSVAAASEKPVASAAAAPVAAPAELETAVNDENFQKEVLEAKLPVLVDFYADWCGPCRRLGPLVKELAEARRGKLKVCKVNVDNAPGLSRRYGITGIPALFIFKDGKVLRKKVGLMPKDELEKFAD